MFLINVYDRQIIKQTYQESIRNVKIKVTKDRN